MRIVIGLSVCVLIGVLTLLLLREPEKQSHPAKENPAQHIEPPRRPDPNSQKTDLPPDQASLKPQGHPDTSVYIGRDYDERKRVVHTVLTTKKNGATYEVLVRYEPQPVSSDILPGIKDIVESLTARGEQLAHEIRQIDQEVELFMMNLGQPLHSIISYRAYVNMDGRVVAYDLAQSTGGEAQRFVGHLTRKGLIVDVFRGGENVDRNEITFPNPKTFIPVELELIHQHYLSHKEQLAKKEAVLFPFFFPEVMGFIYMAAKPLEDQVIAVGDATFDCAHYLVETKSMQASEGMVARQEMWFDKRTELLMKIQEIDPTIKAGEGPITERTGIGVLKEMRPLLVDAPKLPEKPFPYPLDRDLIYTVKAPAKSGGLGKGSPEDVTLGTVRVRFSAAQEKSDEPYVATANVDLNGSGTMRHETARTNFNKNWEPVRYRADGDETSDVKMQYSVSARSSGERLNVSLDRHMAPVAAVPEEAQPAVKPASKQDNELWPDGRDPLRRVIIGENEEESRPVTQPLSRQDLARPLTSGTYLFDFNRLEHLASLVYKFPLPKAPAKDEAPETLYQKAALFFVRQNRGGVLMFEVSPEKKAVPEKKKNESLDDSGEPQLFVASVAHAMMPCSMLIHPDGRILELCMKYGSGEITYTLDDPITRRRAERAQREKLKKGPMLLRPDWW
jgi:hypothetical protein